MSRALAASVLILLAFAPAAAQSEAVPSQGTGGEALVGVESPIISEEYILMPGDGLLITVTGGVTFSYESRVTYEGKVMISMPTPTYPVTGSGSREPSTSVVDAVRISGLTLARAQDTLTTAMGRYFRSVKVKLTLLRLRSGIVFVTGEVLYPGAYNASPVERVSQVVARAGGVAPLGSRTRVNVIRKGRLVGFADIERFESQGNLMANPFVESGDVIFVPAVEGLVTVKGAVFGRGEYRLRTSALTTEKERVSEGSYELNPGERVFDLIRKAGGTTPWADLAHCYVERIVMGGEGTRERLPVNLHAIMFGYDSTRNIEMMNSDILVVPPINTLVYVEGEVTHPGAILYTPNLKASDYIGQAGGPTQYADVGRAYIERGELRLSVRDNPIVDPGDKIMIPRVVFKFWQDYLQILSAIAIPIALTWLSLTLR